MKASVLALTEKSKTSEKPQKKVNISDPPSNLSFANWSLRNTKSVVCVTQRIEKASSRATIAPASSSFIMINNNNKLILEE